jgi:hypothetical protein
MESAEKSLHQYPLKPTKRRERRSLTEKNDELKQDQKLDGHQMATIGDGHDKRP